MKKTLTYIWCLLALATASHAQEVHQQFVRYSVANGLVRNTINAISQDTLGRLWLATDGGISCFNGTTFTNYTTANGLPGNVTRAIAVNAQGTVWASLLEGVVAITPDTVQLHMPRYARRSAHIHHDSQGNVYVAPFGRGLLLARGDSLVPLTTHTAIDSAFVVDMAQAANHGPLYALTQSRGLFVQQQGQWQQLQAYPYQNKRSYSITVRQNSQLLVTSTAGLWRYHKGQGTFFNPGFEAQPAPRHHLVEDVLELPDGRLWAIGRFVGYTELMADSLAYASCCKGFGHAMVKTMFKDAAGVVWLGTEADGLYRYTGGLFSQYRPPSSRPEIQSVSALAQSPGGQLWVGYFPGGLLHVQPGTANYYTSSFTTAINSDLTYHIFADGRGGVWHCSSYGADRYYQGTFTAYGPEHGLSHPTVLTGAAAPGGRVWLGTANGLSYWLGPAGGFVGIDSCQGQPIGVVRQLYPASNGQLLAATRKGLLAIEHDSVYRLLPHHPLGQAHFTSVVEGARNSYWLASPQHGLLHYLPRHDSLRPVPFEPGLEIRGLAMTYQGHLLVTTIKNVMRLRLAPNGTVLHRQVFGPEAGYLGEENRYNATLTGADSSIWLGTVKGIYRYHPQYDSIGLTGPGSYIEAIDLNRQPTNWQALGLPVGGYFSLPRHLHLPHSQNHLTFKYHAVNFAHPTGVRYRHQLQGFDAGWGPATTVAQAEYANLPPGSYRFAVQAANANGPWGPTAHYPFTIALPFWQQPWFYAAAGLFIAGLLWALVRAVARRRVNSTLKLEGLKQQEAAKVRKRVAEDFHDEMGNQFASLSVLVQLLNRQLEGTIPSQSASVLGKINTVSNRLFFGTRDFIWALDPNHSNLEELYVYLKDFGEQLFDKTPVRFYSQWQCPQGAPPPMLAPGHSRHLILIFKEAMTNALKHAHASRVALNVTVNGTAYTVTLTDNGLGMPQSGATQPATGGLANMQQRAAKINATLQLTNQPQGTSVTIKGLLRPHNLKRAAS